LVFSASGSHSGFSFLKSVKRCEIIYNLVPQQNKGGIKAFIGIGKVFYQIGKRLEIINQADSNVDKLMEVASLGDPYKYDFTKYYKGDVLDLNFSGFMKSIDRFLKRQKKVPKEEVAASFQESITEILFEKIIKLAGIKKVKEIHIAGGISENKYLEKKLKDRIKKEKLPFILRYPAKKEYRLDNAAMIGSLAYYQKKYNIKFINFKPQITY